MEIPSHIDTRTIADELRKLPDERLAAMFIHAVGGVEIYEALRRRAYDPSVSNRQLAEWLGVPEATLRSWFNKARVRGRVMGLNIDRMLPEVGSDAACSTGQQP